MHYYSLQTPSYTVDFETAVRAGLAPDKSLFFPQHLPVLDANFWTTIGQKSLVEAAIPLMQPYTQGSMDATALGDIVSETLNFPFPCVPVGTNTYALELFHGPTLAFKDVGARFMSRCLRYFNRLENRPSTVLVATSGDTGGAVADGFLGVEGVQVVILYPKGKVSDFQERQLTTLGQNIRAVEVEGTFDDCQAMVKQAFMDADLKALQLTSANSINVARWLPQMFYYVEACRQLAQEQPLLVACPSGNFGNICAGMMAKAMGAPIAHFVAATNVNDTVPRYMQQGQYEPHPTQATLSNAMDVSDPSNFVRILALYQHLNKTLSQDLTAASFTDTQTQACMQQVYAQHGYVCDPHGAVGYLGLQQATESFQHLPKVFLETAHPLKFADTVTSTLGIEIDMPDAVKPLLSREKVKTTLSTYAQLKGYLLG